MSEEKTARNRKIYLDKKKLSWTKLLQKYGLSYTTLKEIVLSQELKEIKKK